MLPKKEEIRDNCQPNKLGRNHELKHLYFAAFEVVKITGNANITGWQFVGELGVCTFSTWPAKLPAAYRGIHHWQWSSLGNRLLKPVLVTWKLPVPGQPDILLPCVMPRETINTPCSILCWKFLIESPIKKQMDKLRTFPSQWQWSHPQNSVSKNLKVV